MKLITKVKEKRVLMVATVPSMIGQFNMRNINILIEMGYKVDVAADYTDTSIWPVEKVQKFKNQMAEMGIECIQLNFSRSPLKLSRHFNSYLKTVRLINERQYCFIHTHTPIASAIVRLAARKTGTKIIYTAHGFHFYDGAPLKNWVIFYPIEKYLSRYTDVLITINKEDYKRASKNFNAKKTVYIPGVGVDTTKFVPRASGRKRIREELQVQEKCIFLLSVGELNDNKNHCSVIKALKDVPNITYVIAGKGELEISLRHLAEECGVDIRLLGYRTDIVDFYAAADVYILPSIREGLNVSLMEAMASGLPCLVGKIRGNVDLVDNNGGYLFNPSDVESIRGAILEVMNTTSEKRRSQGYYNLKKIKKFDLQPVDSIISKIYGEVVHA